VRAQDSPVALRTGEPVPVTQAERSHVLTVTSTRPPAEVAVLAARASRASDLTRLLALRKRRAE
jgi:hypothetical protein